MNKKILSVGIFAILMLVTISFASAINTTNAEKKESPLYNLRTRLAIGEIIQNLKAKFFGERLFFLQFKLLKNVNYPYIARESTILKICTSYTSCIQCP